MKSDSKRELKAKIKRQKLDRMRALRVVKYLEYPFILPDSPVSLEEGYIVSDMDSCDVFASFIFKNLSQRSLRKLNIRIDCYLNQNIPYTHVDFTYSHNDLTFGIIARDDVNLKLKESNSRTTIEQHETFGTCVYIPLPETYFTKMEVILVSVEYAGGQVQELNMPVVGDSKKYSELDNFSKIVYTRINIYQAAESRFPTKVIPQFGNTVWLCCCGTKNSSDNEVCEKCSREKEWQQKSVTNDIIEETKKRMISDAQERVLHDKTKFKQNKYLESAEESEKKMKDYEIAMKNIAYEEQRKEKRQMMLIPKILLAFLIMYLIVVLFKIIEEFFWNPDPAVEAAVITLFKRFIL